MRADPKVIAAYLGD
ncbi:MAG: hypothetical protein LW626_00275 [Verrucomicrobium sp.]|nr:hypothetical protein [Verrucomicrobium sp.]